MARAVEDIEKAITQLPQEQLRQFRAWDEKFDSDAACWLVFESLRSIVS